ncbi:hypothetical protein GHT06_009767 [Daphnia sinensis]|uniref:Uncharacterized protein n=1 Tax=Daphnia sinensis TaxID=1820382 RepID=A0AAD5L3M6_9CRUS|nr:hypothetical protein GHT06_009767 [Daphnia sinensis]
MQYIAVVVLALAVVDAGVIYDGQAGNVAYSINTVPYALPYATPLLNPTPTETKTADPAKNNEAIKFVYPQFASFVPAPLYGSAVVNKDAAADAKKIETAAIATPYPYPTSFVYGGYPYAPVPFGYPYGVLPLNAKSVTEIKPVKAAETTEEKAADKDKVAVTYVA